MNQSAPGGTPSSRIWRATAGSEAPRKPPYPSEMWVTPLSQYGDNQWRFPDDWITVNNRSRLLLDFEREAVFADRTRHRLRQGEHDRLIEQLKEATWASIYRRDAFSALRKSKLVKPGGAHAILRPLRRLFVAFACLGRRDLHDVTVADLNEAFVRLAPPKDEFRNIAESFQDLVTLSRRELIVGGLRDIPFEIPPPAAGVPDQSAAVGWQPIPDDKISPLIALSGRYIDLAAEIASHIELVRKDPTQSRFVVQWARSYLPCGEKLPRNNIEQSLASLVHIAAANLLSFHAGLRISELMSVRSGFVSKISEEEAEIHCDRLKLEFTTYKTIVNTRGASKCVAAHPRLGEVAEALELIKKALAVPGEYLFVPFGEQLPYITNRFNYHLQRFCDLHDVQVDITSHMWRKTVAGLAVRVLTGAPVHLKELFGHAGLAMTARYILSSPFIREEIRDLTLDEYRKRGLTLLESLSAFGGPGLGGLQGQLLEDRFATMLRETDVTETDLQQKLDEFVDEMLRQGIFPVPVMPGVICLKPLLARGECSSSSGDRMADPSRCTARCSYQVQEAHRRELLEWTIGRVASGREHWSPLEEGYWAGQCRDQLLAWPDLAKELVSVIDGWPKLRNLMQEVTNGREEKIARSPSGEVRGEDRHRHKSST